MRTPRRLKLKIKIKIKSMLNNLNFKIYNSPLGEILLSAECDALCGLWFNDCIERYGVSYSNNNLNNNLKIFDEAFRWLDIYFAGREPDFTPKLNLHGTDFQLQVWKILLTIPYGRTMTYSEAANIIANQRKIKKMAAQAIGQAIGRNNISIIVPCHRVIGHDGSLTGYGGGLRRKEKLLELESQFLNK